MAKILLTGHQARAEAVEALERLALAVGTTLGPAGLPAILDHRNHLGMVAPVVTKDGVTVLQAMDFTEPVSNAVLAFAKQAAQMAVLESGDGTTSTIVVASAIAKMILTNNPTTPQAFARNIESQIGACINWIRNNAVKDPGTIRHVALTSCNGDAEIADVVLRAIESTTAYGSILIEKSILAKERYTVDRQEGYECGRGYRWHPGLARSVSHLTGGNMPITLDKPYVFLYDGELHTLDQIEKAVLALDAVHGPDGFNLMCFAYDMWDDFGQKLLEFNTKYPHIKLCANRTKMSAEHGGGLQVMLDIAAITGAKVFCGGDYQSACVDDLGTCSSIEVTPCKAIIKGRSPKNTIRERIEENKQGIIFARTDVDKDIIRARNAELSEGLVRIIVGAGQGASIQERADRVEDAVKATQSAMRAGVMPGCGMSYIMAAIHCASPELQKTLQCVFNHIMSNYGLDQDEITTQLSLWEDPTQWHTFQILPYADDDVYIKYGNFIDLGVVDAAETICAVLKYGAELGILCATTGCATLTANLEKIQDAHLIREVMTGRDN
jgi:chaperonin GroEL (HSP60 family)